MLVRETPENAQYNKSPIEGARPIQFIKLLEGKFILTPEAEQFFDSLDRDFFSDNGKAFFLLLDCLVGNYSNLANPQTNTYLFSTKGLIRASLMWILSYRERNLNHICFFFISYLFAMLKDKITYHHQSGQMIYIYIRLIRLTS